MKSLNFFGHNIYFFSDSFSLIEMLIASVTKAVLQHYCTCCTLQIAVLHCKPLCSFLRKAWPMAVVVVVVVVVVTLIRFYD